jgi:hypothetical protein
MIYTSGVWTLTYREIKALETPRENLDSHAVKPGKIPAIPA